MSRIPEETIEHIKEQADIVSIISEYIDLKKAGSNYLGLCPFHNEKTPSFTVSPSKEIFHCFGCGEGGDVISFLMKKEGLSYPETIRFLADKLGIYIENKDMDPDKYKRRKLLMEINNDARLFFYQNLLTNQIPKEYLKKRSINKKCINHFFLGYADNSWDSLYNYMSQKGYKAEDLLELGLIQKSKKGTYYDTFRNRLIFPIIDIRKNVLAFGGRTLGDDRAKYINSKESQIYHKRKNVYGTNNFHNISKKGSAMLVEGYMDVISLYNRGIDTAIASLGTAITQEQGRLISRYTKDIYIVYDGDDAGIKAADKAIDIFDSIKIEPKVVRIPDKMDPDDYINKNGPEAFDNLISNAYLPLLFRYDIIKSRYDLGLIDDRIKLNEDVVVLLSDEKSSLKRNEYIDLIVRDLDIDKDALTAEVNFRMKNFESKKKPAPKIVHQNPNKRNPLDKITKAAIVFMIFNRKFIESLLPYEWIYQSSSLEFDAIYKAIDGYYKEFPEQEAIGQDYIQKNRILEGFLIEKHYTEEEVEEMYQNLTAQLERVQQFNNRNKLLEEIGLLKEQDYSKMSAELKEKYKEKLKELFILDKQIRGQ